MGTERDVTAAERRAVPADEPHTNGLQARLNWLRAGVLGANDGIISTAGVVVGVAAATAHAQSILVAGVASLVAGAVSMALGEYVSVSSQRDTERALIALERRELAEDPEGELLELAEIYEAKGLSPATARQVAIELTADDALAAHVEAELGLDPDERTNPWHAALASAVAFTVGALLPLIAVVLAPPAVRIPVTFAAVVVALALTGTISARLGRARRLRAVVRLILGGALAMGITFGIGALLGATVVG
ncbi:VIT family protein [Actinotalea ferrariae]|uniref:VIT1/CCC1 transporter family protein n=1 Tax=Actinotalea ferrariae TaxID=1386098 RepID=UPI001C8CA51C|nr:VIT family protein [Actinotalea ferrariae]MBX9244250.1 VIT family protein [Actinotalea ferrariae]